MFYPLPQENQIFVCDLSQQPVIAGYAANDRIIHTFPPIQNNPPIEPDKVPIMLRFPRQVIDLGKCVYVNFNNQISRYITDPPAIPYQFPTLHNQNITLPVYPYAPEYAITDHQCVPPLPTFPTSDQVKNQIEMAHFVAKILKINGEPDSKPDAVSDNVSNAGSTAETKTAAIPEPNAEAKDATVLESNVETKSETVPEQNAVEKTATVPESNAEGKTETVPEQNAETKTEQNSGSNTQNDKNSKRMLEYDHYFTYENKIYSFFTDHSGEEIDSLLCNFAVYPFCIECVFEKDGSQTKNLKLLVVCGVNQCEISIRPECTDKLLKEIQKHIPQAYINPGVKRGNMVLSAYLSMVLENCTYSTTVKTTGWIPLNYGYGSSYYFYANDLMAQDKSFKCQTGKRLFWISQMSQQESFFHAVRMLMLSADMRKTLPLFLVSHLGVMFSLFENAGFAPRFVTYVYGSSGSLKTSVSKVFFKMLKDDYNDISANFNDTMTALEIKMGTTKDEVLLVDDYRPSALRTEAARMNGSFEKLVRFYGDGIGKGRGNAQLKLRSEFKPMSMCAATGEFLHGTASSLLRLLIIHVDKKTYDKALLKFYQDNPLIFTTHIRYFTDYIAGKYSDIVNYIRAKFPEYRALYGASLTESRLIDAAVCLRITSDIVLEMYAKQCGIVCPFDVAGQLGIWHNVILNAVSESQTLACHLEPYDMYLHAMVTSINEKKLTVYNSKKDYRVSGAGFFDLNRKLLFMRSQDTYNQVVRYWSSLDRPFSASDRLIRQELAVNQFIFTQSEEGKDNTTRVVRLSGDRELRFLVFDLEKLKNQYGLLIPANISDV